MTTRVRFVPLALLGSLIVFYLAVPVALFLVRLIDSSSRGFHQPGLYESLGVSLEGATIALGVVSVLGVPLAYVLARSTGRLGAAVGVVVQLPLALPPLMSGIILIYLVGPYTFVGRLFHGHLTNSLTGVVLAMSFVSAPFLIVAARASFAALDPGLFDVAATLGHGELSQFARVALPAAGGGVRAGMVLAWLRAFGEYGAVIVLAYNPTSLPIDTYNQFGAVGLSSTLAPTALALGVALVVVALSRIPLGRFRRRAVSHAPAVAPSRVYVDAPRFAVDQERGSFHLCLAYHGGARHLAVLGTSGAGKSMLLRCLAGIEGPSSNVVRLDGSSTAPRVGYVAQGFSLFPHLSVHEQLLFARGTTPGLARYWIEQLGLEGLEERRPHELSGGQRQRVALAQALCHSPEVLLLDEPLSALDAPVRLELRRELRRLQRETGVATVLVTHDPEEAAALATDVIVIDAGRALQAGSSRTLSARPTSRQVARLVGVTNVHHTTLVAAGVLDVAGQRVAVAHDSLDPGTSVLWSIRPERIRVGSIHDVTSHDESALRATLVDFVDLGTAYEIVVWLPGDLELVARVDEPVEVELGEACLVFLAREAISCWRVNDGALGSAAERQTQRRQN
ncbi:MAG TPA: ATP-binding cassette domain-containing protein [Acidimicrobiales bacterium]|nr:ATP-binding cassette domain-containing protein [Acidimicrobiales bacterium]